MQVLLDSNNSQLLAYRCRRKTLLQKCINDTSDKLHHHPEIFIMGNKRYQHRDVAFFSNTSEGYRYSGQLTKSQALTKNLDKLLKYVNNKFKANFNGILINRYNDGNDYIGAHSDDESALDKEQGVVSISVGSSRIFRIRNKFYGTIELDFELKDRDILQMKGQFQKHYTHEIPIQKKVLESRISFTFRHHII